jgi:predicted nucleic acid-binding Zn ribbon protein
VTRSRAGDDERDWRTAPRPVSDGLEQLARRLGAPSAASLGAVFAHWEETVGEAIAAHARPVSLNDGVLVVAVDEPGWATQLRYLSTDLIRRLSDVAGDGVVGRIEVRVEGLPTPRKRPPFRRR